MGVISTKKLGEAIKSKRTKDNISQAGFSKLAGLSRSTIRHMEAKKPLRGLSPDELASLARALDTSVSRLLSRCLGFYEIDGAPLFSDVGAKPKATSRVVAWLRKIVRN